MPAGPTIVRTSPGQARPTNHSNPWEHPTTSVRLSPLGQEGNRLEFWQHFDLL